MPSSCTVALDWTPNTNHAGFYVAQADGLYASAGLEVTLLSPDAASAGGKTPARLVEAGEATYAVAPSETAISYATTDPGKPRLVAVAALLQGSPSAICTLKSSGIDRPAAMAGKRYASYELTLALALSLALTLQAKQEQKLKAEAKSRKKNFFKK